MTIKFASEYEDVAGWATEHRRLWTNAGFRVLGQIHLAIATASNELYDNMARTPPGDVARIDTLELTSLGRKVGLDAPGWWVFEQAADVSKFWNDTKLVFWSAQTLVRGAERFGRMSAVTYSRVIDDLSVFCDQHITELNSIASYIETLGDENRFAPAILFSGAVWGDTRRADRSLEYYADEAKATQRIMAGELASGIRHRDDVSLADAWSDLMDEHGDEWQDTAVTMPVDELLRHAQALIRERLIAYFIGIRDSVRHLDKLCQQYLNQRDLHFDLRFLRRFVRKVCSVPHRIENELWDAKEVLNVWRMPASEKELGAIQFAEDVAAFANRRGGVLLIGVSDSRTIVGIADAENRLKQAANIIRTQTDLHEDVIRVDALEIDSAGDVRTCLVVVVGRTAAPVGVRQRNGYYSYPRRVGAGIERVSREEIATEKAASVAGSFEFFRELATWV